MERYQVLLYPEQRKRLEEIARRERRSMSSVLRQALDVGLDVLEGRDQIGQVWKRRRQILARARKRLEAMPLYEGDLIDEIRQERDAELERVWRGEL